MDPSVIKLSKADLPKQLRDWDKCPEFIWASGDAALLDLPMIAVVGSRKVSREGVVRTKKIVKILLKHNICVVSGLAIGVDETAHSEALSGMGKTVAVMGTAMELCYPAAHKGLKQKINERGLLLTQFAPDAKTQKSNFPRRNELMAALCQMTIVVEASETSGTKHQVRCALKLGRRVAFTASITKKGISWIDESLKKHQCFIIGEVSDLEDQICKLGLSGKINKEEASTQLNLELPTIQSKESPLPVTVESTAPQSDMLVQTQRLDNGENLPELEHPVFTPIRFILNNLNSIKNFFLKLGK